jgi:hypothetical protein
MTTKEHFIEFLTNRLPEECSTCDEAMLEVMSGVFQEENTHPDFKWIRRVEVCFNGTTNLNGDPEYQVHIDLKKKEGK